MTLYLLNKLENPSPIRIYENISSQKRKFNKILYGTTSLKSDTYFKVKESYESYLATSSSLETIVARKDIDNEEKEALIHCYNGNTKDVKKLKRDIISKQNIFYQTKCAYCGLSENKYMDHFLPKENFPEFSILSYNLIPSCSYCNEKKSEKFLDSNNNREFFNPYFDDVISTCFIICNINCYEEKIEYTIKTSAELKSFPVIDNHICNIDLVDRYAKQMAEKISSRLNDLRIELEEYSNAADKAKLVMERKLKRVIEVRGINSLEAIMLKAILNNALLFDINYLKKLKLK